MSRTATQLNPATAGSQPSGAGSRAASSSGTVPLSRKQQKAQTREQIYQAALSCFAENGYSDVSIDTITQAAGVAKGTFYVHFSSKENLLDDGLDRFNAGFLTQLQQLGFGGAHHVLPPLTAVAEVFLDYWQANRLFIAAYAQRAAGGMTADSLHEGINPRTVELLCAALAQRAAEQGAGPFDAEMVVHGILAIWLRLGLRYVFSAAADRQHTIDILASMTIGALIQTIPELTPLLVAQSRATGVTNA